MSILTKALGAIRAIHRAWTSGKRTSQPKGSGYPLGMNDITIRREWAPAEPLPETVETAGDVEGSSVMERNRTVADWARYPLGLPTIVLDGLEMLGADPALLVRWEWHPTRPRSWILIHPAFDLPLVIEVVTDAELDTP